MKKLRLVGILGGLVTAATLSAAPAQLPTAPPARSAVAPVAAAAITVVIDDKPVDFRGASPQRINGSVLVPMRVVFERLGATVQFHPETRTIEATKGDTYLILRLGDSNAFVNNSAIPLAQQPVVIGGATLVPLRFVAQVFGARVAWMPAQRIVSIHTGAVRVTVQSTDLVGRVVAVNTVSSPQQISVSYQDQTIVAPVATDTQILVQRGNEPAAQSTLSAIQVGDHVSISRLTPTGPAKTIRVTFGEVSGAVKDVVSLPNGSHVVLLDNGANTEVAPGTPVTQDGNAVGWPDIKPGVQVTIRTEPEHQVGYSMIVTAAAPAVAEVPVHDVAIDSFRVDAAGPLKGGDTITATLHGTAGGSAEFAIPGVVDSVPMKEDQAGVYLGSFVIPSTVNINGASVIGRLTVPGGCEPVLIQAPQTVTIDSKPPVIANLSPSTTTDVSNGRPRISATLDDGDGSGVDTASAHMFIDGQDVTAQAIVTQHFVTYQPADPLADGEHRVRVVAADMVGNSAEAEWKFVINARNGLVTSLESNLTRQNAHIAATRPLRIYLHAQAGGQATFSVGSIVTDVPLTETTPGVYEGTYTPDRGASAQGVQVTAKFVAGNGSIISTTLDTPVTIDAAAAVRPTITDPKPDDAVLGHCVIAGTAAPNATVLVTVGYKSPSLGDLVKYSGKAASTEVQADETGHWRTEDLKLYVGGFLSSSTGTIYTATAVVVDATGQKSAADIVRFRQMQ